MAKLLVVDDEAAIRLLIRKYAEYEGHSVEEAADGMEAVRMARGPLLDEKSESRRRLAHLRIRYAPTVQQ